MSMRGTWHVSHIRKYLVNLFGQSGDMTCLHCSCHGASKRLNMGIPVTSFLFVCSIRTRWTRNFAWFMYNYLLSIKWCNFKAIPTHRNFDSFTKKPWWLVQLFFLTKMSPLPIMVIFDEHARDMARITYPQISSQFIWPKWRYDVSPLQLPWCFQAS